MTGRAPLPIYLDLDDVLAETTRGLVALLHARHGRRVPFEALHSFDLRVSFGLSDREHDAFLDAAHQAPFLDGLSALPGAAPVLEHWNARGHALHVVTGRPPHALEVSRRWLRGQGLRHDVLASVDKYGRHDGAAGSRPLEEFARERYALAVEDSLEMARFLALRTGTRVALMDRPWNRHDRWLPPAARARITRVYGWDEIFSRFPEP